MFKDMMRVFMVLVSLAVVVTILYFGTVWVLTILAHSVSQP